MLITINFGIILEIRVEHLKLVTHLIHHQITEFCMLVNKMPDTPFHHRRNLSDRDGWAGCIARSATAATCHPECFLIGSWIAGIVLDFTLKVPFTVKC